MHHNLAIVLHIRAVAPDHPVKLRKIALFDLRLRTSRADIHLMTVRARLFNSLFRRIRTLRRIIDQCAIHIQKYDLAHILLLFPFTFSLIVANHSPDENALKKVETLFPFLQKSPECCTFQARKEKKDHAFSRRTTTSRWNGWIGSVSVSSGISMTET